jgi:hypothetical protein
MELVSLFVVAVVVSVVVVVHSESVSGLLDPMHTFQCTDHKIKIKHL